MANTISPLEKQGKSVEHNLLIFHQLESTKMPFSEYGSLVSVWLLPCLSHTTFMVSWIISSTEQ